MTDASIRFLDRRSPPHIATLIIMCSISALTMNIFLPSLPNMTAYFDTEYRIMSLSVSLYLGANAVLQVFIGPISDRFGRRPVVLTGFALFLVATLGCIFAPNATVFLIFRMCQAVVSVGLVLSRAIIRDIHPQDKAASTIGYVTMGMAVAPMISPAIGGAIDSVMGWRGSFWLLFISGALVLWLCWIDQGESAQNTGTSFRDQIREYPELLTSPRFWGYALACALCSGSFFSYLGGAPFVGSEIFSLSPQALGLYFGAPAIGYFLGNFLTGRYAQVIGVNRMVLWGCLTCATGMALSLALFAMGFGTALLFFGFMTFIGLGNGLAIPNATAGMLSVRPHLAGTASGLGGALMIGGGAALSALAGSLLTHETGAYPLLLLMLVSSLLGVLAIFLVIRRERRLELAGA
ncbi:multidrug effflux MFS transporter [Marinibacterium profundimaris]|uniref:Bcr/CflA family efflux transporter n=1 Tax=Marinibacterium profundimaris TaxID=1679460 RepID=A0A225NIV0_9RHOB|nr:multidrug effflux MFS transporter [Marinibacterium profundimaris]OWU72993.1 multidrug MFS transporter [Marinibacterium profundimaris]